MTRPDDFERETNLSPPCLVITRHQIDDRTGCCPAATPFSVPRPNPKFAENRTRMPSGDGDACYFPRDLGRGSYGGDVHCLQRFLSRKGYLNEEPTGYFGDRTAIATKRWQVRARAETIRTRGREARRESQPARAVGRARHAVSRASVGCQIPRSRFRSRRADARFRGVESVTDENPPPPSPRATFLTTAGQRHRLRGRPPGARVAR